ncbi:MAG TPA: glycosyl hydrolase family 28-related protein [Methylomirabilota bacterium]
MTRLRRLAGGLLLAVAAGGFVGERLAAAGAPAVVSVRDAPFGARGDGVTDDTDALRKAIDVAAERHGTAVIPPGTYVLTAPIRISGRRNFRVQGGGGAVGELSGVSLRWNGPAGVAAIVLDRVRDAEFSHFSLAPGTRDFEVGIEIGQFSKPGPWISTHNRFRSVHVRGGTIAGIRLSRNASDNNELHTFDDVTLNGPGRYGLYIGGMQSKWHRIIGGSIADKETGIHVHQGSFLSSGTNFSHNRRDIHLRQPVDAILIEAAQSEGASQFLTTGVHRAAWAVTVKGSRLSPGPLAVDGGYLSYSAGGPLVLIGNDFADGVTRPAWRVAAGNHPGLPRPTVVAIGNVFPNERPFRDVESGALFSVGNVWSDDNTARPLPAAGVLASEGRGRRGSFTISGDAASAAVVFDVPEKDDQYFLSVTPTARRGAAAPGANRVQGIRKAPGGFTVTVETAPGAGHAMTFDWHLVR